MTQIKSHIPKIRFKEFSWEWEEWKINKFTSYVDYRGRWPIKTESWIFLITAKNIKKWYIDYNCSKEYVAEDNYLNVMSKWLPKKWDILFTTEAPLWNIWQIENENIALAQRVIKFRWKENVSNNFLLYYMLSDYFQKLIIKKAIGSTVIGIQGKILHNLIINLPQFPEQQKIASFLSSVDEKIENIKEKKKNIEEYKKWVMQKFFKQEIRFKDEIWREFGEWEDKKLGEVATFLKWKGVSKSDIIENWINQCIRYWELYTEYWETIRSIKSRTNLNINDSILSIKNDVIIPASWETQIDIATASCILNDDIILWWDLNIIRWKFNGVFLSYYLNSIKKIDIARLSQWISVVHLYSSQLKSLNIQLPSLPEQQKIVDFLSEIDEKIEKVSEELDKMEEFKQGLLQGMFV